MEEKYDIGLPEFTVIDRQTTDADDYIYTLDLTDKPSVCPLCGSKLHVHKTTERKVQDLHQFGHRVGLIIHSHRYRCSNKDCGNTVGEDYPSIYSSGKMTVRLRDLLKKEAFFHTFKELADEYGISISAVSTLFKEEAEELNKKYKVIAPKILGIDELHLKKNYCGVFVNIEEGRVIEIKDNRSKKTVIKFIESMEDRGNIECVTMDMWNPYRDAVAATLPKIPVVVDKFHVIKELNKELDAVRSATTKKLKERKERVSLKNNRFLLLSASENLTKAQNTSLQKLLDAYPEFTTPYLLKESFRDIYLCESRAEAEKMFTEWVATCETENFSGFDQFISMVYNWKTEIFNYFDHPYTNAETESLNRTIRDLDKDGRGYSFDVLRDKVVLKHLIPRRTGKFEF